MPAAMAAMAPKAITWWSVDLANEADLVSQTTPVLSAATKCDVDCRPVALTGRMQLADGTYRHSIDPLETHRSRSMTHRLLSMRDVLARICISNSVSSTSVSPRYRRRIVVLSSWGVMSQRPCSGVPSSAAKQAGESKRGRQSQSRDPWREISAAVWVSPINA